MNNLEFLSFERTPQEKHLGIATVRYEKRFIFRFKIQQNPKGEGYFSNPPAIKIAEQYFPAFTLDSSYEADNLKKFVLDNVKHALAHQKVSSLPLTYQAPQPEFDFNSQPPF